MSSNDIIKDHIKMTEFKPYTPYEQENGQWGFFVDDECEQFYSPFDSKDSAQKMGSQASKPLKLK